MNSEMTCKQERVLGSPKKVSLGGPSTVGILDLRHVFRSKKVLVFGAMEDITNDEYLARS